MELFKAAPLVLLLASCSHVPERFVYPVSIDKKALEGCEVLVQKDVADFQDVINQHLELITLYRKCSIKSEYLAEIIKELENEQIIRLANPQN